MLGYIVIWLGGLFIGIALGTLLPRAPTDHVDTLDELVVELHDWQLKTFPQATALSKTKHLQQEVTELMANPEDWQEVADCFMLIVGIAMIQDIDLTAAVRAKLEINKARRWGVPDADGVVRHVKEDASE